MREPPELLLLYLNCNTSLQLWSGSNSKEMLKKQTFNNFSVIIKHEHALPAGHPSSICQGPLLILLARAQSAPTWKGYNIAWAWGCGCQWKSKANFNVQVAPALFPCLYKSQNKTAQIQGKSILKKKLCQIDMQHNTKQHIFNWLSVVWSTAFKKKAKVFSSFCYTCRKEYLKNCLDMA